MQVKNKATVDAPWVYISTSLSVGWWRGCGQYMHSAWGFRVARFDLQGDYQSLYFVERATGAGSTLFLCRTTRENNR